MTDIVVIGGGWAGCSASLAAIKAGAEVLLLERTDMLLGCGLAGGIMRNNGRYTAAEELKRLGNGELIDAADACSLQVNISFPGHEHASLYDTVSMEPVVRRLLQDMGVKIRFESRVTEVVKCSERRIEGVVLTEGETVAGDVFIEATGSAGPMSNCARHGNGCSMCVLRCPSFGPRVSLSLAAGVADIAGTRKNEQYGSFSGSCELNKNSLKAELRNQLEKKGVVVIPLPESYVNLDLLQMKACHQYARPDYVRNIILLDTGGRVKMMMPFCPLELLRTLPGLEYATYEHSRGGGNSLRFLSRAPRDNAMRVTGLDNLFCAGEKAGFFVGHTEAMVTGSVAGLNSVRSVTGKPCLELPTSLVCGDLIAFENAALADRQALQKRYTFAGGEYFDRMAELELYTTDHDTIVKRVDKTGLTGVFAGAKILTQTTTSQSDDTGSETLPQGDVRHRHLAAVSGQKFI
ncbi:MAG: FAD-dependent oxidoreductase [Firmicutes bacterium]|nr:FAD-dependent oxidoreductase [Bacillota bacterium]